MKRVTKAFLPVLFAFVFFVYAFAGNLNDLKRQNEKAKQGAKDARSNLGVIAAEKDGALTEIFALDAQLTALSETLFEVGGRLAETENSLSNTRNDLDLAEKKREGQYAAYKKRVRYQYMNGRAGYLDVIFKSTDVADFINRVEYVNKIVETDRRETAALILTEQTISAKITEIEETKARLNQLNSEYERAYQLNELARENKARRYAALCADEGAYQKQLDDFIAESEKITKLIRAEEAAEAKRREEIKRQEEAKKAAAPAAYAGGKLGWPVPSCSVVSSGYGVRNSPINGKQEFHTGIDIIAAFGADIAAAEGGTVIFAGVSGGYGNTVIINHGNGLSTLYAHNSSLAVSQGQSVSKGQLIARAGSTGYSTGNHLHFEVRINGTHTNPMNYVN